MALSEHEQRLLDEMERSLYQSDADFVATDDPEGVPDYRAVVGGVILALLGLGGAVAAVAARVPWLGVLGFALMVAGVLLAFRRRRDVAPPRSTAKPKGTGSPVMDAFEDRWERRQERRDQ